MIKSKFRVFKYPTAFGLKKASSMGNSFTTSYVDAKRCTRETKLFKLVR